MFRWFYLFPVLISLFCLVDFYEHSRNNSNKNYLFLFLTIFFSNYGYCMCVYSETLEGILCGHQIYYIGSILTTYFLLIVVVELTRKHLNNVIRLSLFAYALVIIFFIITASFIKVYYSSLTVQTYKGISYLKKQYGPAHIIFLIYLFGIAGLVIGFILQSVFKKRQVSTRTLIGIVVMLVIGLISYIVPRAFHFPLELQPFAFCIIDIFVLVIVKRMSLYDMSSNILSVYEQQQDYGYIALSLSRRFMGANEFAFKIFPELKKIPIDSKIQDDDSRFSTEIVSWINLWLDDERMVHTFEFDGISVSCSLKYINSGGKKIGYLVELKDETEQKKYVQLLDEYNRQLRNNVEEKTEKITQIQDSIITGMASMVESRDNSTGGHIKRTSGGVKIFLEQLKKHSEFEWLTDDFCKRMIKAAPMHDLGKIAIDDAVLRKPGKFTDEEYEQMKKHTSEGAGIVYEVLREVDDEDLRIIAMNVAHYHHEKWDGTGYPTNKAGEDIPIEARIMAFADVFDALVTKRCYKDAFSYDEAFSIIEKDLGTHFDPVLGKVFLECREELEQMYTLETLVNNATNMF